VPLEQIIFLQSKMLELQCGHRARWRLTRLTEIQGAGQVGRDRSAYGTDVYADQRYNQLFDLPLVLEEKDE
jgi:hypothetical protein